jgi:hypothetical protein
MDSVDDPLPLDEPGFLYNLHSRHRRGSPRPARPSLTGPPTLSVITITGTLRRPVCLSSEFRDCEREVARLSPGAPVTAEAANGHRQRQAGESGRGGGVHSGPHSRGDLGNGEKDSKLLSSFWFYEAGYS